MAATFEILNLEQRTKAIPGGGLGDVTVVTFRTLPSHLVGSVDIPDSVLSPAEVAKVAGAKAELLEAIKAL